MGNFNQKENLDNKIDHTQKNIILIGDSTLDNIVWVNGYQNCIKAQLQELQPNAKIHNLASDGFTSKDVLVGNIPVKSYNSRQCEEDPFPTSEINEKFYPLKELEKIPKTENDYIVLSIGGNDIRLVLGHEDKIQKAVELLVENYRNIVEELRIHTNKIILMMQYRPSYKTDQQNYKIYHFINKTSLPGINDIQKLNTLMEIVYLDIVKLAFQYNLPLIDLGNTFDIYDDKLYGLFL